MVWRPKDLEQVNPKTQAARIAHTIGERKRVEILDQAKKANIRVLNPGVKKEAEVAPPVTTEPTEPAPPSEPAAAGTTEQPTEVSAPETEVKETEETKEPPKKRKTTKKSKKRSKK
jgi:large subunit ribosomal protein L32e